MTDLRVRVPDTAATATYNGQRYPVVDGVARIPDDGQLRQQRVEVLPRRSVSLSHLPLAELRCTACGRRKLEIMGTRCAWCGGTCEAV